MTNTVPTMIDAVAEKTGFTKQQSKEFLNALGAVVQRAAAKGDESRLPGIGVLKPVTRAARKGRNPQTGATIDVPEKQDVKFKSSKELRDSL